jgi:hypothetical protein
VLQAFLDRTASQLTFHGLLQLHEHLRERQLCVFFRNNHFCTMFKVHGKLYLLVTDEGYGGEPRVVWELLDDVGGDTEFCTAAFALGAEASSPEAPSSPVDADYLFALQLQGGVESPARPSSGAQTPPGPHADGPIVVPASAVSVVQAPFDSVLASSVALPPANAALVQSDGGVAGASGSVNDEDAAYARLLQEQLNLESRGAASPPSQSPSSADSDEHLAMALQEQIHDDERRDQEQRTADRQRAQAATAEASAKKKASDCAVQ